MRAVRQTRPCGIPLAVEDVLKVAGLSAAYGNRLALRDISFAVRAGELWAVLGPNGAGKSTLLRTCLGLQAPRAGQVSLQGIPLDHWPRREVARRMAWVPQSLDPFVEFTGLELVLMGRSPHLGAWGLPSTHDVSRAKQIMTELGIEELASRPATALSGGERRLLLLARALVQQPSLLILDEPTAFLDLKHQAEVMRLIKRRSLDGLAVLAVVHDVNQAAAFADRVLLLKAGAMLACGDTRGTLAAGVLEELFEMPIATADAGGGRTVFAPELTP